MRSAMLAASQLPGRGAHCCGYGPCTCTLIKNLMILLVSARRWSLYCNQTKVQAEYAKLRFHPQRGWSGGVMVLGKLPVPGHPANLDKSGAGACCPCGGCWWGLFGHFFSHLSFLFFLPLSGRWPDKV